MSAINHHQLPLLLAHMPDWTMMLSRLCSIYVKYRLTFAEYGRKKA